MKEKALSTSKYVSVGNNSSSDPANAVASDCLLEKLEKESSF